MGSNSVICLQSNAFYELLDQVIEHIDEKFSLSKEKQWVDSEVAMNILNIRSKSTLQELRNTGKVRFAHPQPKIILYDRNSLLEYIEKHARNTF